MGIWNAPQGTSRQWRRSRHRRRGPSAPPFVRFTLLALVGVLAITLSWRGIGWALHPNGVPVGGIESSYSPLAPSAAADARSAGWQRDFNDALESARQDVADEQIGAAEVAVDRAETILTTQRLITADASPEFFEPALVALDRVLEKKPDDARLVQHVTLARISLAEFRSSLVPEPALPSDASRISMGVPREIAAGDTLGPSSFGGRILDASLMPDTSEILLPPSTRAFADNIRVENLVLQGAAQTLDGIHWRDVTFVGTRLRYEGGELDLQDVQFVHCRFGFAVDQHGERTSRLANAIAQGKSAIQIP